MVRRLSALGLALVIVGAPVAGTICEARCQSHEVAAIGGPAHHHHHSPAPTTPSTGIPVNAGPQACDHQSGDILAVQQTLRPLAAPALLVAVLEFSMSPIPATSRPGRPAVNEHSPPGSLLALTAQLRV